MFKSVALYCSEVAGVLLIDSNTEASLKNCTAHVAQQNTRVTLRDMIPVVRVLDAHIKGGVLHGGLHRGGVQDSGAKKGELSGLIKGQQGYRLRFPHYPRV